MMKYAVRTDGLSVRRGRHDVLRDIDLAVPVGQVVGLLGPSGGGKSTLMRSVVGVQERVSGTVEVLGEPAGSAVLRRRVGYVTQSPSIYRDLTVGQNLRYFATLVGADGDRVVQVLGQVDLDAQVDRRVADLSGGQASRVSLAAALVGSPDLLVLDEPTVGLDPVLRRSLWRLFAALAASGTTVLVSSHVMDEAARCDRLVLLREGRILADDTLPALLDRTGADDAEGAFLRLVDDATAARTGSSAPGTAPHRRHR